MQRTIRIRSTIAVVASMMVASFAAVAGCSKESAPETSTSTAPSASATTTSAATASTSAAPPPAEPKHDCPAGSSGDGSASKPCLASGNARMLEITYTGKSDDDGSPMFNVKSKSKISILFGKLAVYFYDKAGKQLSVDDTSSTPPKSAPFKTCSGLIFGGVVKPDDKFVVSFSCMKKDSVPADAKAIEVEAVTVGFADASEKKTEFYWSNPDLAPDARKKGGAK